MLELGGQALAQLLVEAPKRVLAAQHQRGLAAESMQDRGELDPDIARPDDQEPPGR